MALTITKSKRGPDFLGSRKLVYTDITFDNSYPAGGYPLTPAMFGGRAIEDVEKLSGNALSGALVFHYDKPNKKLMVLYPTGGAGAAPAALADPAITAGGTGQNPVIPGRGKEIANATNLTTIAITARVTML